MLPYLSEVSILAVALWLTLELSIVTGQYHYRLTQLRPGQPMRLPQLRSGPECPMPYFPNGVAKARQRNKLIRFTCAFGFQLVGNTYSMCEKGRWDTSIPICIRWGCAELTAVDNEEISYEHGQAAAMLFCSSGYQVAGPSKAYCNGTHWDRPLGNCRQIGIGLVTSCDFETPDFCGWMNEATHDFDWKRSEGIVSPKALNTGPKFDHTTGASLAGHFMIIDSMEQFTNETARLLSPIYPANYSTNACFLFYYHMFGDGVGTLSIYVRPVSQPLDSISIKDASFVISGNQRNVWNEAYFDLNQYSEAFQIVIEASMGMKSKSDIAIDDVSMLNGDDCLPKPCTEDVEVSSTVPNEPPPEIPSDDNIFKLGSCENRCGKNVSSVITIPDSSVNFVQCDCCEGCVDSKTCCPDYAELCVFNVSDGSNVFTKSTTISTTASTTVKTRPTTTSSSSGSTTTASTTRTTRGGLGCPELMAVENGQISYEHGQVAAMLFCSSGYQVAGPSKAYCNGTHWDRPLGNCRETGIGVVTSCDFETPDFCGWMNEATHDLDWKRSEGIISPKALKTGPKFDHTTGASLAGHFMMVDSVEQFTNETARLLSSIYPANYSTNACFLFYYHMFGDGVGTLSVYVKSVSQPLDSISIKDASFVISGNQRNVWIEAYFDLNQYAEAFQIVIEASLGMKSKSDIAIDDVSLLNGDDCRPKPGTEDVEVSSTVPDEPPSESDDNIFKLGSCENRCGKNVSSVIVIPDSSVNFVQCDCFEGCVDSKTCCQDYAELCVFNVSDSSNVFTMSTTISTSASTTARTRSTTTSSSSAATILARTTWTTRGASGCPELRVVDNGQISYEHGQAAAMLFCSSGYQVAGPLKAYCNGTHWDRQLGNCVVTGIGVVTSCDFETPDFCGWMNEVTHGFDWKRSEGIISPKALATGPKFDHTTGSSLDGHFMMVDSVEQFTNETARLLSSIYPANYSTNACFLFYYHMFGDGVGTLSVYVRSVSQPLDSISIKDASFVISGNQRNVWIEAYFDLNQYAEAFQIVIEASLGMKSKSDIAIDDVSLLNGDDCRSKPGTEDVEVSSTVPDEPPSESDDNIFKLGSCENRCGKNVSSVIAIPDSSVNFVQCDCCEGCVDSKTCCPDYAELCVFNVSDSSNVITMSTTISTTTSTKARTGLTTTSSSSASTTMARTTRTTRGGLGCPELMAVENGQISYEHGQVAAMLLCSSGYQVAGPLKAYCNETHWDRQLGNCVVTGIGVVTSCDFETPDFCGWMNEATHDFDWKRSEGIVSPKALNTGPKFDHTTGASLAGHFMMVDSMEQFTNETARLLSPIYPANYSTNACFMFYYHMFGDGVGKLSVYVRSVSQPLDSISIKDASFVISGNQRNVWNEAYFDLNQYAEAFQIVIEASLGMKSKSDIAIDDVSLLNGDDCRPKPGTEDVEVTSTVPDEPPSESDDNIFKLGSCENRCGKNVSSVISNPDSSVNFIQCDCFEGCVDSKTCCPDYADLCVFNVSDSSNVFNKSTTISTTASTTARTRSTTTSSSLTSTTTASTTWTTPKPKTTLRSSTILRSTTTPSVRTTISTTTKPTSTTKSPTTATTKIYNLRPRSTTTSSTERPLIIPILERDSYSNICPKPELQNGMIRMKLRGKFLRFDCNKDFTLVGAKYILCKNGRWNSPAPICIKDTLAVYVKPLTLKLEDMLKQAAQFTSSGNQGNAWNEGYFDLQKQTESFQIVIQASLGMRYKSDTAIDDVALLNGSDCQSNGTDMTWTT